MLSRVLFGVVTVYIIHYSSGECTEWTEVETLWDDGLSLFMPNSHRFFSFGAVIGDLNVDGVFEAYYPLNSVSAGFYMVMHAPANSTTYTVSSLPLADLQVDWLQFLDVVQFGTAKRLLAFGSSPSTVADKLISIGLDKDDQTGALSIQSHAHILTTSTAYEMHLRSYALDEFLEVGVTSFAYTASAAYLYPEEMGELRVLSMIDESLYSTSQHCYRIGSIPRGYIHGVEQLARAAVLCIHEGTPIENQWHFRRISFDAGGMIAQNVVLNDLPKGFYSMEFFVFVRHGVGDANSSAFFTNAVRTQLHKWSWEDIVNPEVTGATLVSPVYTWTAPQRTPSFTFADVDGNTVVDLLLIEGRDVKFLSGVNDFDNDWTGYRTIPAPPDNKFPEKIFALFASNRAFLGTTYSEELQTPARIYLESAACTAVVLDFTSVSVVQKGSTTVVSSSEATEPDDKQSTSKLDGSVTSTESVESSGVNGESPPILLIAAIGGAALLVCVALVAVLFCVISSRRQSSDADRGGSGTELAHRGRGKRSRSGTGRSRAGSRRSRAPTASGMQIRRNASRLRGFSRGLSGGDVHYGKVDMKSALSADNVIDHGNEYGVVRMAPTNVYESTTAPLSSELGSYDTVMVRKSNPYDDVTAPLSVSSGTGGGTGQKNNYDCVHAPLVSGSSAISKQGGEGSEYDSVGTQ